MEVDLEDWIPKMKPREKYEKVRYTRKVGRGRGCRLSRSGKAMSRRWRDSCNIKDLGSGKH